MQTVNGQNDEDGKVWNQDENVERVQNIVPTCLLEKLPVDSGRDEKLFDVLKEALC
jgi:hypothetical protein